MTNFEAAVELSLNKWVASLPTDFALPEPTESYKQGTAKLIDKMRGDRYHKFTRSTARAILIAAIIMAIATAALAATVGKEFIIQQFEKYSTYSVVDISGVKNVDDVHFGYIPKGFKVSYKKASNKDVGYEFESSDEWINIYKIVIDAETTFDTEHKNREQIVINALEGVYYENPNQNYSGIVWNDGVYIYTVEGNIPKNELIKIAENIR